jgi:hypothetical protein
MEFLSAAELYSNIQAWIPDADLETQIQKKMSPVQPEMAQILKKLLMVSYEYIQTINQLSSNNNILKESYLSYLSKIVDCVQQWEKLSQEYHVIFKAYNLKIQNQLSQTQFNTNYFDEIKNLDLKIILRNVILEMEIILKSFSLVSLDLQKIQCIEIYENCIRLHLLVQYVLLVKNLTLEEEWSITFDIDCLLKNDESYFENLEDFKNEVEALRKVALKAPPRST